MPYSTGTDYRPFTPVFQLRASPWPCLTSFSCVHATVTEHFWASRYKSRRVTVVNILRVAED